MKGLIPLSRGTIRILSFLAGFIVLYIFVIDSFIRPPTRSASFDEFEAAEMGIPNAQTLMNDTMTTSVLIVSAFFPLAKSKHSKKDYEDWLSRFLKPITTDMYMFTTPELAETVQRVRGEQPIAIDTTFSSPFQVPPLQGYEKIYTEMNDIDPEKWHHSPGLYAIWNAKPYLLDTAVKTLRRDGKVYTYAFWNDAGSFRRDHQYSEWPNPARVEQVWEEGSRLTGGKKEDLLFFPIFQLPDKKLKKWKEGMGPISNSVQFSEGSFFGGSPSTIEWFSKIFYAYHYYYLTKKFFVGIDQDVFNALFLLFPERIFTVWMNDPLAPAHQGIVPSPSLIPSLERGYLGECGAEWFYYQFWLADAPARDEMRRTWMGEERWRKSGWWQERKLCRLTTALSMMDVLKRAFGEDWHPPRKLLAIPGL